MDDTLYTNSAASWFQRCLVCLT